MGGKARQRGRDYAALARAGHLDAIWELVDCNVASQNDRDAYKWLCLAKDFGHEEAGELIGDVLEVSSMRYDDDGGEQAAAHWELAVAYLCGDHDLPVDLVRANRHLEQAFTVHDLDGINESTRSHYRADTVLERLTGDARRALEFHLAGGDLYRRFHRRVDRTRRLKECSAPSVIVENEQRLLQRAADELLAAGPAGLAQAPGTEPEPERSLEHVRRLLREGLEP